MDAAKHILPRKSGGFWGSGRASGADEGANIEEVEFSERDDKHSHMRLQISVKDRKHVADVIRRVRSIRTVVRVARGHRKQK